MLPLLADWVYDVLRCPLCGGGLARDVGWFHCPQCVEDFPLVEGVPILLDSSISLVDIAEVTDSTVRRPDRQRGALEAVNRLIPSLGRSRGSAPNYALLARLLSERTERRQRVLVVGGRVLGSGMDPLLDGSFDLVETDVELGPRTAIVCDAQALPFASGSFDAVVVQAVLPAVPNPDRAVAEIHRVLVPAGLVYAEDSFMQQVWGGRRDFTRWTYLGHRRLFRQFDEIRSGVIDGPGTVLAWAWQYFLLGFAETRWTRLALRAIARLTGFWLKYFDRVLATRRGAYDGASGFFFLGQSRPTALGDREIVARYRGAFRS